MGISDWSTRKNMCALYTVQQTPAEYTGGLLPSKTSGYCWGFFPKPGTAGQRCLCNQAAATTAASANRGLLVEKGVGFATRRRAEFVSVLYYSHR